MLVACLLPTLAQAGWTSPLPVNGTGPDTTGTQIAGNPDSAPLVVWTKPILGINTVQAAHLGDNGTTGPVLTLSSAGQNAENPVVSMSPNGNAVVAWVWTNGVNDVIQSVTVTQSDEVGAVADRSAVGPAGEDAAAPRVAILDDRTSAITWRKFNGTKFIVQARVVNSSGTAFDIRDIEALYDQNTDFPDIAAISDGTFKVVWAEGTGDFGNVGTQGVNADGSMPLPPTYAFPTTAFIDGVTVDSGVTGEPSGARIVGFTTDGNSAIGWLRDIPTDPEVPSTAVRSVESTGFSGIILGTPTRLSPDTHDVSQFSLAKSATQMGTNDEGVQTLLGGNLAIASWTTEDPGNRKVEVRKLTQSGGLGITAVVSGAVGTEGFPQAALSLQNWATVTWFESTGNPLVDNAKASRLTPGGLVSGPVENFTTGSLTSTSNPGVAAGANGVPSVVFDATDNGNLLDTQVSVFSDPGLPTISPADLAFGGHILNIKTKTRSVFLLSTGSTSNFVQNIGITGADASEFTLAGASDCSPSISPGELCSIGVNFTPTSKGSKTAQLTVQTEGGPVVADITGNGINRTRVSLGVKPKNIATRKGKTKKVTATVTNSGGLQATGVKVCAYGNKRTIRPKKKCQTIGALAVGQTVKRKFSLRLNSKAKKGKKYTVNFQMKSNNANSRRASSKLKAKN